MTIKDDLKKSIILAVDDVQHVTGEIQLLGTRFTTGDIQGCPAILEFAITILQAFFELLKLLFA